MDATRALSAWEGFPVHAESRPLIVIGRLIEESGYTSSEAKIAFYEQRLEIADGVPVGAAASLTAEIGPLRATPGHRLVVEGAVRIRHAFRTDRGSRQLDAWAMRISETLAPVVVVDIDERARTWPLPSDSFAGSTAQRLDATDTLFRYTFMGSPRRYTYYDGAEVATGDTAVAVSPRATEVRSDGLRFAHAETRHVEFSLPSPLGPRVLVDTWGNPIEVPDE